LGRIAPTHNAHKKHGNAVLFNLSEYVGTAIPSLRFKGLFQKPLKNPHRTFLERKVGKRTFTPKTPLYFGEAFEIPKDFSRKVLCVRVWGG